MGETTSRQTWPRRPGLTTARLIAIGLALLCTLVGWLIAVFYDGFFVFLGLFLLSIWVVLKGGPLVVRLLERAGLFGRVKREGDRLTAGRGTHGLRLDDPFRLAIQYNQKDLSYEIRLDHMGVSSSRQVRTESKGVSMLLATVEQDDRSFHLVAEEAGPAPPPSFDLKGLSYHQTPIAKPVGPVVRMHPDDLVELLRVLHKIEGGSVVAPPETRDPGGDPRRLFWPTWKWIAGFCVLLGLGIYAAIWAMEYAPAPKRDPVDTTTDEKKDSKPYNLRAERLIGKRVHLLHAAQGVWLYGVAKAYTTTKAEGVDVLDWPTTVTVEIDAIEDAMFKRMPTDTKVPFGPEGKVVGIGSAIEIDIERIRTD